jgi:molecular chaperone HtpG
MVVFESLKEDDNPMIITQSEFMRRMKDMSALGGEMGFYKDIPDNYNLVVNANHPLIEKVVNEMEKKVGEKVEKIKEKMKPLETSIVELEKASAGKKDEEIKQEEKDRIADLKGEIKELEEKKTKILADYGKKNKLVKQIIDLALLSNNMLKGEELNKFVKRSIEMM